MSEYAFPLDVAGILAAVVLPERQQGQRDIDFGRPHFNALMKAKEVCSCGQSPMGRTVFGGMGDEYFWVCRSCSVQVYTDACAILGLKLVRPAEATKECSLCGHFADGAAVCVNEYEATLCRLCYRESFVPQMQVLARQRLQVAPSSANLDRASQMDAAAFLHWSTFKVGDAVRVPKPRDDDHAGLVGRVAKVMLIHGYDVVFGQHTRNERSWFYNENELVLVKAAQS